MMHSNAWQRCGASKRGSVHWKSLTHVPQHGDSDLLFRLRDLGLLPRRIPGNFYQGVTVRKNSGVTLVELLVVIAVIGVLLIIIVSAVFSARQASTNLDCKNKLRQIGLATQNFISSKNAFPVSRQFRGRRGMILLLPYLEMQAVFDELEQKEDAEIWWPVSPIFRCEADGLRYDSPFFNYIPCGGVGDGSTLPMEVGFWSMDNVSLGQVIDGLTNTAVYSERLVGEQVFPNTFAEASKRYPVHLDEYFENVEQFELNCWRVFKRHDLNSITPVSPYADILIQYTFGTRFTPNGPSCIFASSGQTPQGLDLSGWESYTANSNHHGYVNVSFGDASIQSISDGIDPRVWRAMGTIAGRDGLFVQ